MTEFDFGVLGLSEGENVLERLFAYTLLKDW